MTDNAAALRGNWNYPTAMRFGPGRIAELPDACKAAGMGRPLLVTDPGLANLQMVKDAIARNEAAGIPTGLFAEVKGNPIGKNVEDGLEVYRAGGHDGVIAFGGGSALDAAKAVALMAGQTRPIWDFEDVGDNWMRVDPDGVAPVIAVPTTAGTGSEVGRASVITNEATHVKKIIFHPKMLPVIVISDPELTVGLPPHVTAATGMDALAHCLEAYCAPGYHPMADGIAVEGMRLVKEWLPVAVKDGKNVAARAHMMAAASMGATAFQKGLGAIHALSHPVGAVYDTHHGLTNAVFMPYVLAFNRKAIEPKMTRLAAWLGLPDPSYQSVMDWVLALRKDLGIPHTLKDLGVGNDRLDELSAMAADDPSAGGNPVPIGAPELKQMFVASLEGRL
ncbi:iron-containing alcohol dehydrogenase [Rhodospirillaceae bacterium SYSU D60014]|uniref:iron-containing alcohol dehydrogenase n=1 Tax=Virgifigura deserti TaxID=2268457 RepID=UPI000E6658F0